MRVVEIFLLSLHRVTVRLRMLQPLPPGTLLRQRYLIQQTLGQGGFGRTYLALDRERFNDRCVLKELVVSNQDPSFLEQAKALFHREAGILYRLEHPQIPRFWAAFEDNWRLFLVQDFIAGESCRHVLQQRQQWGQTVSEREILHLLAGILPVLCHIHDRGLIHRDISPDNLLLKPLASGNPSLLETIPCLIDFGSVKAAATPSSLGTSLTRIGKVGYAPPEQLQTGKVYPHSDLYALAVTCLVLLTAQEPAVLMNSQSLTWQWQPYVRLNDRLSRILQRMLAIRPGDRYPTVREVWADLGPLLAGKNSLPPAPDRASNLPVTEIPATAWDQSFKVTSPLPLKLGKTNPLIAWAGLGLGALASVSLGVGIAALSLKYFFPYPYPNSALPARPPGGSFPGTTGNVLNQPSFPGQPPFPFPGGPPSTGPLSGQPIEFAQGKISTVLQGNLQDYGTQIYQLKASHGQIVTASLDGSGVVMSLLRSNQQPIDTSSSQTRAWTGQVSADDNYLIQISGSGSYSLDVAMTPAESRRTAQRLTFARGTHGVVLTKTLEDKQTQSYLLEAAKGQQMVSRILQGDVGFRVVAPNAQPLTDGDPSSMVWQSDLPLDGDYTIEVVAQRSGSFVISIEVL